MDFENSAFNKFISKVNLCLLIFYEFTWQHHYIPQVIFDRYGLNMIWHCAEIIPRYCIISTYIWSINSKVFQVWLCITRTNWSSDHFVEHLLPHCYINYNYDIQRYTMASISVCVGVTEYIIIYVGVEEEIIKLLRPRSHHSQCYQV